MSTTQTAISAQSFGTSTNIGNGKFSIAPLTLGAGTTAYVVNVQWTNGNGLVDNLQQVTVYYTTSCRTFTAAAALLSLGQTVHSVTLRPNVASAGISVKDSDLETVTGTKFYCWVDAPTLSNAATLDVVLVELP